MALLRSAPRYLLDTESYLYDEASPSFEDTFYSAPAPAPAPVVAAPAPVVAAPAPAPAFNWQPGQAWDPTRTESYTYNGDLYMPGFETDWLGQQQLTGLTRFIGGKQPEPGQTVYTESYDPMTGKPIPGLSISPLTAYKVDPTGGTFFEALMGALPLLAPIGAYAMGIGATGAGLGAVDLGGAGIAEGMAPGVLAPASAAELAAVNSIAPSALDAGMGAYPALGNAAQLPTLTPAAMESLIGTPGYGVNAAAQEFANAAGMDVGLVGSGSALPFEAMGGTASTAPTETTGLSSDDRAALRSNEGYGSGMTGTQTSVYDNVLAATGSKEIADLFSSAVGSGTDVLSWLKNNPTAGRALFSAAGAMLNTAGGGGSGGGYVDSGYRPTISRGGFNAAPQARRMTPQPTMGLLTPTAGQPMSGLWRYGLLGG